MLAYVKIPFDRKMTRAARHTIKMLQYVQHRGQQAAGIASFGEHNGKLNFRSVKDQGLVKAVFKKKKEIPEGYITAGHTRYTTSGGDDHLQPIHTEKNIVAIAHNGNLPETKALENYLIENGIDPSGLNDSGKMQRALEKAMENGTPVETAFKEIQPLLIGAYSLVGITNTGELFAVRDPKGIRPLSVGKLRRGIFYHKPKGYVVASETYAIEKTGGKVLYDVKPGEMVIFRNGKVEKYSMVEEEQQNTGELDIFEIVYFLDGESKYKGEKVAKKRYRMGREAAKEIKEKLQRKIKADMVIAVPNTAIPAAKGFAKESNIHFRRRVLQKRKGTHRTFIASSEKRIQEIDKKFKINEKAIKGKEIILVDDSLVRGSVAKALIKKLKDAGAAKIHLVITSPPVLYPDHHGIATPNQEALIAARNNMDLKKIREELELDGDLSYLSIAGLFKAIGRPQDEFSIPSYQYNKYPTPIGEENKKKIRRIEPVADQVA